MYVCVCVGYVYCLVCCLFREMSSSGKSIEIGFTKGDWLSGDDNGGVSRSFDLRKLVIYGYEML